MREDPRVIAADEMPDDNADLAGLEVDFDRLEPDTAESCPLAEEGILEYLSDEVPGGSLSLEDLRFLRTAQVGANRCWIWSFSDPTDGSPAYLTVSLSPDGQTTVGYEENYYNLTPEQFMLGDYHMVF